MFPLKTYALVSVCKHNYNLGQITKSARFWKHNFFKVTKQFDILCNSPSSLQYMQSLLGLRWKSCVFFK